MTVKPPPCRKHPRRQVAVVIRGRGYCGECWPQVVKVLLAVKS